MPIAIDGQSKTFSFKCHCCGQIREGGPSFAYDEPSQVSAVPEEQRASRVKIDEDLCSLDGEHFFIRATLEIPIKGASEGFLWGVWVTQSRENFYRYVETFNQDQTGMGSFGWLNVDMPGYRTPGEQTVHLPADICWGNERPEVRIHTDQDHPLAIDQREGLSWDRAVELALMIGH